MANGIDQGTIEDREGSRRAERIVLKFKEIMRRGTLDSMSTELDEGNMQGGLSLDELDAELTNYLEFLQNSLSNDTADLTNSLSAQEEKKKEPMRKHDIRRYFSRMFFNVINSTDFDEVLSYFETFMHATAPLDIVFYSAPLASSSNTVHHLRVEGPHTSSYYIMCLGALFPDMVTVCTSGKVVTSSNLSGCKLVLEATLECTSLGTISLAVALQQLARLYDEYRRTMLLFPLSNQSMSSSTDSESPSNRRRTEGKAPRRNLPTQNAILQARVHTFVGHIPPLPTPVPMVVKCSYIIILDERNHISSISVTAVRES